MNVLLMIKYKLQSCRVLPFIGVMVVLPAVLMPMVTEGNSPFSGYRLLGFCTCMCSMMLFGMTHTIVESNTEFWAALPFSPIQIFLAKFVTRQITFFLTFLSCVAIVLLLGSIAWDWGILQAAINVVTCNGVISMGISCFWRPPESISKSKLVLIGAPLGSLTAGILFAVVASTNYLGWWPTCVALAVGVPLFFVLRSILREIEPLTGERPLFKPDISFKPTSSQAKRYVSKNVRESTITRVLGRRLSPVSRYIVTAVWMDFRYLFGLFYTTFMITFMLFVVGSSSFMGGGSPGWLFFIFVASVSAIQWSSTSVRALSSLPIETRRLFFLVLGPYFVAIAIIVILPYCLGFPRTARVENWCYYDSNDSVRVAAESSHFPPGYALPELSASDYRQCVQQTEMPSGQPCKQSPRLKTVAQDFSDALWKQYHIQVLPQDLISYNTDIQVWTVSAINGDVWRQDLENKKRVGWFVRTSLLFFFLFGVRTVCFGGRLVDISRKKLSSPIRNHKTNGLPVRQKTNLIPWAERVVLWLGFGVVGFMFVYLFAPHLFPRDSSLKFFLLDHYPGCWIALLLGIYAFYRMSLQAFRRVY